MKTAGRAPSRGLGALAAAAFAAAAALLVLAPGLQAQDGPKAPQPALGIVELEKAVSASGGEPSPDSLEKARERAYALGRAQGAFALFSVCPGDAAPRLGGGVEVVRFTQGLEKALGKGGGAGAPPSEARAAAPPSGSVVAAVDANAAMEASNYWRGLLESVKADEASAAEARASGDVEAADSLEWEIRHTLASKRGFLSQGVEEALDSLFISGRWLAVVLVCGEDPVIYSSPEVKVEDAESDMAKALDAWTGN
jgi:hypothetical protein